VSVSLKIGQPRFVTKAEVMELHAALIDQY